MDNIPIDIHYNKLLDWLVDRRHCNLKWQQAAAAVKLKVNTALQDVSNDLSKEMFSDSGMNYFTCQKMVKILEKTGEGSKNMFGQYSSQKMKNWSEILHLYQKDNTHLAEAAHLLIRNVNYEIPSLKKQIAKCQQTQRDCTRKESENIANAAIFKEKYLNECKHMGVKGENVKKELLLLVDELPSLFKRIADDAKILEECITYYSDFVDFLLSKSSKVNDRNREETKQSICPMLRFICENGNATVYQWRTGALPKQVRKVSQIDGTDKISKDIDEIEWSVDGLGNADNFGIDFGDDLDAVELGNDAINFGESEISLADTADICVEEDGTGIDFGIETVDESSRQEPVNFEKTDVSGSNEDGIAIGVDALSVLENGQTRNLFIDELVEVQSFLFQRFEELSCTGDILSAKQFQSAPAAIQMQSKEAIEEMLSNTSKVISDMTSTKMQNLYRLKSSPHYVDRLADSLHQKLKTANNLLSQARAVIERKESAKQLQISTEPKLKKVVEKTKELKKDVEEEISKKYKNRPVNIMGEINSV